MADVDDVAKVILIRMLREAKTVIRRQTPDYVQEWHAAQKDSKFKACMAKAEGEVSPPGWSGSVKAMKKHADIDNPWALAWYMHGQGATPHHKPEKAKKSEGGPGSGPQGGGGARKQKYVPQHIANRRDEMARNQRADKAEKGRRAALKKSAKGDNSTMGILRQRGYDV